MQFRRTVPVVLAACAAALFAPARPADAVTGVSGDLGTGGIVKGDISRDATDMDSITVSLQEGQTIGLKWKSMFSADVHFTDPNAQPVGFSTESQRMGLIDGYVVPLTGTYTFTIASLDGSQGTYSLKILPKWDKVVKFDGTGPMTFDVPMPLNGTLKGVVRAAKGSTDPSITSLTSPEETELLAAPVTGKTVAKLPAVTATEAGVYHLSATAAGGATQYSVALKRIAAPTIPAKVDLRNGIDVISFSGDGIDDYFQQRCVSCHDWARSYNGVRAFARDALGRMKTGNMPKDGPRTDAAFLSLFSQWISTGYAK